MTVTTIAHAATYEEMLGNEVAGFALEHPQSGADLHGHSVTLQGWALGARAPVDWVVLSAPDYPARKLPVNVERPDVAEAHPDVPWASRSGFRAAISTLALPGRFELYLDTLQADGTRVNVGVIQGSREPLRLYGQSRLQPLIVTTLGRTGSTWLTGLLGQHPELLAWRPYDYEPRAAWYWMDILATLSEPQSYQQLVAPDAYGEEWWLGTMRRLEPNPMARDPEMRMWLETGYIEELVSLCKHQIESFYRHAVSPTSFERASHFVEKVWPGSRAQGMLMDLYPGMREIFLVRDFRDIACSVFAFIRRLGYQAFGREDAASDADYIRGPLLDNATVMLEMWKRRCDRAHLVRYEDLVSDPARELSTILDYIGADSAPQVIESMIERGVDTVALEDHLTAASVSKSIGRWRSDLSAEQHALFEESYEEILAEFDYAAR